jgi:hypothetical protein
MMTTVTRQLHALLAVLVGMHHKARLGQMVAPSVLQDTPITTAIHQRHV